MSERGRTRETRSTSTWTSAMTPARMPLPGRRPSGRSSQNALACRFGSTLERMPSASCSGHETTGSLDCHRSNSILEAAPCARRDGSTLTLRGIPSIWHGIAASCRSSQVASTPSSTSMSWSIFRWARDSPSCGSAPTAEAGRRAPYWSPRRRAIPAFVLRRPPLCVPRNKPAGTSHTDAFDSRRSFFGINTGACMTSKPSNSCVRPRGLGWWNNDRSERVGLIPCPDSEHRRSETLYAETVKED